MSIKNHYIIVVNTYFEFNYFTTIFEPYVKSKMKEIYFNREIIFGIKSKK